MASALARRVRRLELAADEVAAGRFIEPLPVDSRDELGELTRTFNEMQEQLARVDVARREFIATASHELRTPIFSLAGFVELLQDEDLDEDTRREFLDTMSRAGGAPAEAVGGPARPLAARRGVGRSSTPSRSTWPSWRARSSASSRPRSPSTDTDLEVKLPVDGPRGDAATVSGWPRSCASCSTTPCGTPPTGTPRDRVGAAQQRHRLATVSDAGPGLSESTRDQAFERFFTGDAPAAPASAWRSRASSPSGWTGGCASRPARPAPTFTLELPTDESGA